MKGYLLSIIGTVILSSVLTAILPNGKTTELIKSITRIACILTIVAPVLRFFHAGNLSFREENLNEIFSQEVINQQNGFIEYYSEMRIRETERALEQELLEKYKAKVSVTLRYERQIEWLDEKYETERIKITQILVRGREDMEENVWLEMLEYLRKNYCSEVLIE